MRDTLGVSMRRARVLAAALIAAATFLLVPRSSYADEARLQFLTQKMRDNDARVRTSAALSLGASKDDAAIEPLCGGLADREEVVRQASAVALKRLNKQRALGCLRTRATAERTESVKVAITRAIESIASTGEPDGSEDAPIRNNPNAKYYVSLSTVANQTNRSTSDVESIVLRSIRRKLDDAGVVQLAPSAEPTDRAKQVIKSRKLKGFYLSIAVDRFDYSNGNLRVRMKIAVFNYPNKAMLGSFDKGVTAQGVRPSDKSMEDQLLEAAAGAAADYFAQNASAFL